ncbi:hypothetical protein Tco_1501534 [Tanacetum coccineum]
MMDYSLWEVIENGNAPQIKKVVETTIASATAEEKTQRRLELKARSTLLMGIPNEHQLKFNSIKYAKSWLSCCLREVLDQTFDRLQNLISQLEIHSESISQDDVNQKFLSSLSPEWNTHTIVWRNKPEIDTLSLDDLYNNLKIYEPEVKGTSSSSTNTQNVAFVSSNSTNSTNGAVNTAHGATTASTQATAVNSTLKKTIDNLKRLWLTRGKEILKENTGREVFCEWPLRNLENKIGEHNKGYASGTTTSNDLILCDGLGDYDWSDQAEEEQNEQLLKDLRTSKINAITYKTTLESVEARLLVYKKNKFVYEEDVKLTVEKLENSSKSLSKLIDCQIVDKCKTGLGYNAVPPPYTRNFMPPKLDLSFSGLEEFVNEPIVSEPTLKSLYIRPVKLNSL